MLDEDIDTLIGSLQIRPECVDDVRRIVQKHGIKPDDFLGKLIVRIADNGLGVNSEEGSS